MLILNHLWIILALPLAGAAINGLCGKNWSKSIVNTIAVGSVSLSFLAVLELVRELGRGAELQTKPRHRGVFPGLMFIRATMNAMRHGVRSPNK